MSKEIVSYQLWCYNCGICDEKCRMGTVGANAKKQQEILADCLRENSKINIAVFQHLRVWD